MKLSICLIIKNEKYIKECLDSLQPIMKKIDSELIIIDTISEDTTVEIVKRYTDKVFFHKWNENFSEMKNIAISYAKGEWIFILYGDEIVDDPEKLITILNSGESQCYDTGSFIIKGNKHENNDLHYGISQPSRLLRNQECSKGEDNVYEQINDKISNTSIIILTYNNLEYNKLCIESIREYTKKGTYEIIIVDNNSTDGTVEWMKEQNDLKLILNAENLGFPKGCNQGIEASEKSNDILLLNNDTIVTPNWLDNLKFCLYSSKNIGSVGSVTNSCSNHQVLTAQYSSMQEMLEFAKNNNKSNSSLWEERVRLVGFCMLIKREVVNKIGVLDEIFTPGNFEDDDYSLRIRKAGYRLVLCKDSFIHHFGSASFSKDSQKYVNLLNNNREEFMKKWGIDPYSITDKQNIELKNLDNNKHDDRNLKFLLRRIENNIEYNDSISEIVTNIKKENFNCEDIIMSVEKHGIKKEMLLNTIALECYKERMVDFSLQLLIKAHEINSMDKDTIYNIAYIVNKLGDKELAITFLNSVQNKDDEMIDLMRELTEEKQ